MSWNPLTWWPFTKDGRSTLVYLALAGCGPALLSCIMWMQSIIRTFPGATGEQRLDAYVKLAEPVGWALLIIVAALACFVSIRSIKGPGGTEVQGREDTDDAEPIKSGDQVTVTKDGGG